MVQSSTRSKWVFQFMLLFSQLATTILAEDGTPSLPWTALLVVGSRCPFSIIWKPFENYASILISKLQFFGWSFSLSVSGKFFRSENFLSYWVSPTFFSFCCCYNIGFLQLVCSTMCLFSWQLASLCGLYIPLAFIW